MITEKTLGFVSYFRDGNTIFRMSLNLGHMNSPDLHKLVGNTWEEVQNFSPPAGLQKLEEGVGDTDQLTVRDVLAAYGYTYNGIPGHGSPDLFNALDSLMEQFRPGLCTALSLSPETTVEKIMIQAGMFSKNREEFEAKMREYAAIRLPWSMWPLFVDLELMRFQITGQD